MMMKLCVCCAMQLTMKVTSAVPKVAHQGVQGAYTEVAARKACPGYEPLPCEKFEVGFQASQAS